MKGRNLAVSACLLVLTLVLGLLVLPTTADAAAEGYYTYTVSGGKATITDCDPAISGNVTLPSTLGGYPVTALGRYALSRCNNLTAVTVPDSILTFGDCVFASCEKLQTVTVGNGLTSIPYYAFSDCPALTSVKIGNGVTGVSANAFYNCPKLASVSFGTGLASVGNSAFSSCAGLTSITISTANPNLCIDSDGVLFNKDKTELLGTLLPLSASYTVPDSVVSIGSSAFYYQQNLTTVTFGKNVRSVGYQAFWGCINLTNVYVSEATQIFGSMSISSCEKLQYNSYGGAQYLGSAQNPYLVLIKLDSTGITQFSAHPQTVSVISGVFSSCKSLTHVSLPSIKSINSSCFADCSALQTVDLGSALESIGEKAFENCKQLTSVRFPATIKAIGEKAFYNCTAIKDIYVTDPNNWCQVNTSDYGGLFAKLPKLHLTNTDGSAVTRLVLDANTVKIPEYAFYGTNITSVTIPATVKSIGRYSFAKCAQLKTLVLNEGLAGIYANAFDGCSSLDGIVIPDSVTYLGDSAFNGCSGLSRVVIGDRVEDLNDYVFSGCQNIAELVIGDSITYIPDSAFSALEKLKKLDLGHGVTTIGEDAFRYCNSLKSLTIPDNVTHIGKYAFSACHSLETVCIGTGLVSMDYGAFSHRTSDSIDVYITDPNAWCKVDFAENSSPMEYPNAVMHILDKNGNEVTKLVLDSTVTKIPVKAFAKSAIQTLVVPSSVDTIDSMAFGDCDELKSVTIANGLKTLGSSVFVSCDSLTQITLPNSITVIDEQVFYYCANLQSITLPQQLETIGSFAFHKCFRLESISIPKNVVEIGTGAFYECNSLTGIWVDPANTVYKNDEVGALLNKSGTRLICYPSNNSFFYRIPSGVTTISGYAFSYCPELNHLIIPLSVTSFEYPAFSGTAIICTFYEGTENQWHAISKYSYFEDSILAPIYYNSTDLHGNIVKDHINYYYENGTPKTGWVQRIEWGQPFWFYYRDGLCVTGWLEQNGKLYYLNGYGRMVTGIVDIDGKRHIFDNNGVWQSSADLVGWFQTNNLWYYYQNGAAVTGWKLIGGVWYYFDEDGIMQTGEQMIDDVWYYLKPSGAMHTGWLQDGYVWYYYNASGARVTGIVTIGGHQHMFDKYGIWLGQLPKNGWKLFQAKWYYCQNDQIVTGWKQISGVWYYFNTEGIMQTGWQQISGTWYYFNSSGAMATGWLQVGSTWYYFKSSGAMTTGWLQVGGIWYYFQSGGAMQTGWLKIGNIWYYFHSSGAMATSPVTLGSKTYRFDANGACLNP